MRSWDMIETPLGDLFIVVSELGLCQLDYGIAQDSFLLSLPQPADRRNLSEFTSQIAEYFARERRSYDLPLDLRGLTQFQLKVAQIVNQIPYGEMKTYGQVAALAGSPHAPRAVGQAMRRNPIPLVIPCHRVVGSDSLGGYGGPSGAPKKRWLLEFEGALAP